METTHVPSLGNLASPSQEKQLDTDIIRQHGGQWGRRRKGLLACSWARQAFLTLCLRRLLDFCQSLSGLSYFPKAQSGRAVCVYVCVCVCVCALKNLLRLISLLRTSLVCVSRSVMSDSLQPHGLQPSRLLCPWPEYWSGLPLPSPGNLSDPEVEHGSPALQADSLLSEPISG